MGELSSASILCKSQGNSGKACRIPARKPARSVFNTSGEDFHCFDGEVVISTGGKRHEVSGIYGMAVLQTFLRRHSCDFPGRGIPGSLSGFLCYVANPDLLHLV